MRERAHVHLAAAGAQVMYVAARSGRMRMHVAVGAAEVEGSPFEVHVHPSAAERLFALQTVNRPCSAQRAARNAREVCFAASRSSSAWRSFIGRSRTARSSRSLPSCRMGRPRRLRCARGTASSLSRGSCCSGTPQRNRARQPTRCPALGGHVACGARSPSRGQLPQLVGHRGQTEPTGPTPACASMRSSVHAHVCRHAHGRARKHRNTHIHAPARTQ